MATSKPAKHALTLLLLAWSAACGQAPDTPDEDAVSSPPERPDEVPGSEADTPSGPAPSESPHTWLQSGFVTPGITVGELRQRFGPPDRRTATPTPNRHVPDQTDTLVTLEYDRGLTVELYAVTGGADLLQSVVVSSPGVLSYGEPVDVGTGWEEVTSILGAPSGRRDGMPFYACEGCPAAESPVYFEVVDGVVRQIRFSYYVD